MTRFAKTALFAGSALALQALTTAAMAAEAPQVEELIVTAQKREQSLQDVPAAISAIGAADIARRGIRTAQDLQFQTPSLQAGTGFNSTVIFLRGVGQTVGQPGVAVHVDGVYQARSFQVALPQVDLARIEVLRGPQGTLYGRNATAGAVNFITNAPSDKLEGYVLAGYGDYDTSHLEAVVNIPASDRLRVRGVVDYVNQGDGFVKNVVPGNPDLGALQTLSGRLRVQYDVTDALTADLSIFGMKQNGVGDYLLLHNFPTAAAIAKNPYLAGVIVPFEPWRTSANRGSDRDAEANSTTLTLTWKLGKDLLLKSISNYTQYNYTNSFDADGTQLDIFPTANRLNSSTVTQEFDLSGVYEKLDWLVGAYYLDDKAESFTKYDFPLGLATTAGAVAGPIRGSQINIVTSPYKTESMAVFADGTFHLTPRLRIFAGARYSDEHQKRVGSNIVGPIGILPAGPVLLPILNSCTNCFAEASFEAFTPRGGVQYDLDEQGDRQVYATISKGFKSGGINAAPDTTPYAPEKLLAYEAGLKTRFLDRRAIFNATAFYYDYTDFQLSQIIGLVGRITNASAATVKGLEFEAAYSPDDHWTLNANLSLLDAKYDSFLNTDGLAPELGVQNLAGKRLNYSPTSSGNIGIQYRTPVQDFGTLTARAELYLTSKVYFREFNLPLDSQAGYDRLNLTAIWDSPEQRYRVRAYVTNVGNKAYIATMGTSDNFGARYINWGPPRQFGVELSAKY